MQHRLFPAFFLVLICTLTFSAVIGAEESPKNDLELRIAGALAAAPDGHRDTASVAARGEGGALVMLREGEGDLLCLADDPGNETFHVACYHKSLEDYMRRGRELKAEGVEGGARHDRRHEEVESGKLKMPEGPASVYTVIGEGDAFDPATGKVRNPLRVYAIYIPYATEASTGLPTKPSAEAPSLPWLMRAGTPSAHIMVTPGPAVTDPPAEEPK